MCLKIKLTYLLLIGVALVALNSCGTKKKVAPEGMRYEDLSSKNIPLEFCITSDAMVETTLSGAVEIKAGDSLMISVADGTGNLELFKNDLKGNDVNKLKRIIFEDASSIFYESAITESEFHFIVVKKKESSVYEIQDIKSELYDEATAKRMFDIARAAEVVEGK